MKLVTIIGARPQFVKAAVVSRAIEQYNRLHSDTGIHEIIVHSGQHYDANMSEVFFEQMQIPQPHYNLGVNGGLHGAMTGQMLAEIEKVLIKEQPDAVLVYGDTNSTLAGALAAAKLHIPIAHVEAGLRSFNMQMPEEINRILTDRISQWLFCPTKEAVKHLESEGMGLKKSANMRNMQVFEVGDVMLDAAIFYRKIAKPSSKLNNLLEQCKDGYYVATIHRADNTDNKDRLKGIAQALNHIGMNTPIVLPLHPRTRKKLADANISVPSVSIIDPVGYFDMICLLENCQAVLTDSGGLQKEAYFFQKPCITMRDETEWVELVQSGSNILVGANYEEIIRAERQINTMNKDFSGALYGDGNAGKKIVDILVGDNA